MILLLLVLVAYLTVEVMLLRTASYGISPCGAAYRPVTVMVAARNEAAHIGACIESLLAQRYPAAMVQILIGDDGSEDATATIIQQYQQVEYHRIESQWPGLRGKQNVLAHLAHHARNDIFVITDADITHHPDWLAAIVAGFDAPEVGLVTGGTIVHGNKAFHHMQTYDWLVGVLTIKACDDIGMPITAVGNNMAVTRAAYRSVGGYEALPFSITEDFLLFKHIRAAGYRYRWLLNPVMLNRSAPMPDFSALLHQRKRWYKGGTAGPWYAGAMYFLFAATNPLLVSGVFWLEYGWALVAAKILADFLVFAAGFRALGMLRLLRYFPVYVLYHIFTSVALPVYFIMPTRVIWKGRSY